MFHLLSLPPEQGFIVFALSFLLLEGAWDKAEEWASLTAAERTSIKAEYAAAGIKLIVSAFGSTDAPTSSGADPVGTANNLAAWVKQYGLDGVDVGAYTPARHCSATADLPKDYEDFGAFNGGTTAYVRALSVYACV